jgi:hypothetical protein
MSAVMKIMGFSGGGVEDDMEFEGKKQKCSKSLI